MKAFPAAFETEKNLKTGATSVYILKIPFATGTVYLSDYGFTITSWSGANITAKGWVSNWGGFEENIQTDLAGAQISEATISVIIDPDAALTIKDMLNSGSNSPEVTLCELYAWFVGLSAATNPPQLLSSWNIIDWDENDELSVTMRLVSIGVQYEKTLGNKITRTAYPNCDPDVIGKQANIVIGSCRGVECQPIDAGWASTLVDPNVTDGVDGYDSDDTAFIVSSVKYIPTIPFTAQIEEEQVRVTAKNGTTLTVTRAYNSTKAKAHAAGVAIYEVKSAYTYLIADHPISRVNNVYADSTRLIAGYTVYTGKNGNAHASYPGKAVIVFASKLLGTDIVSDALISNALACAHQAALTFSGTGSARIVAQVTSSPDGTAKFQYVLMSSVSVTAQGTTGSTPAAATVVVYPEGRKDLAKNLYKMENNSVSYVANTFTFTVGGNLVIELTSKSSSVTGVSILTSGATMLAYVAAKTSLSGNSAADVTLANKITVDVDGSIDDASGSITASANALCSRPDHVFKWLFKNFTDYDHTQFYSDAGVDYWIKAYHLLAGYSSTAASSYTTSSISPTANRLVLLSLATTVVSGTPAVPVSVTGCGLTWQLVTSKTNTWDTATMLMVYRAMGSAPTAGALTIAFGANQSSCCWSVEEFSGTDISGSNGAGAIVQTASNQNKGATSLTASLSAFAGVNNATFGCCRTGVYSAVAGSGFTQLANVGSNPRLQTQFKSMNDTLVDWTSSAATNFIGIAVEIKCVQPSTQALFASHGYALGYWFNNSPKLSALLAQLAWQCRCYYRWTSRAELLWRSEDTESQKAISADEVRMKSDYKTTMKISRSPLTEVVNYADVYYDRDFSKSGDEAYEGFFTLSNDRSIGKYGQKERPELFRFDAISSQAQAAEVAAFILKYYAFRKKKLTCEVFWDQLDVEFGDCITFEEARLVAEILSANLTPGSARDNSNDIIRLTAREIKTALKLVAVVEALTSLTLASRIANLAPVEVETVITMHSTINCTVAVEVETAVTGLPSGFGTSFGEEFGQT
jgi:hypothetical protein